jgi:site-specific DNA recombinase
VDPVSVPQIVEGETFDLVAEKLSRNKKFASRNNKSHQYLLRALVSCGACGQGAGAPYHLGWPHYYVCRGHHEIVAEQRCRARHAPGSRLDELVWKDLCEVLTHPEHVKYALRRAHGASGMPQELKARLESVGKAVAQTERQQRRLWTPTSAECWRSPSSSASTRNSRVAPPPSSPRSANWRPPPGSASSSPG